MGSLRIVVLYDRVLVDETEEQAASTDKTPVVRTLDKKEVEEEVADALTKLGHEPVRCTSGRHPEKSARSGQSGLRSGLQPRESFADDDTADFKIGAFLDLLGRKYTVLARTG